MLPVNVEHIRKFITFAAKKLKLPSLPQIKLVGSSENKYDAFGHSSGRLIVVRVTERHIIDILRTIFHELVHYKQNILGIKASENFKEDQANLIAGRIMRDFDTTHPEVFKDKAIRANMGLGTINEDALGGTPANAMSTGGIETYDPKLQIPKYGFNLKKISKKPKKLRHAITP